MSTLSSKSLLTFNVEELVLSGDLRGAFGGAVCLAVERPCMLWAGVLQGEAFSGAVGDEVSINIDLLWRHLSVQGDCGLGGGDPAGHEGRLFRPQVHNLKVDSRRYKQLIFVLVERNIVA